ncbi:partial Proton-translocating ferredoxin:NAD(+) oxidoreductase complex subunit D, partial [Anaerolineae bacterium]
MTTQAVEKKSLELSVTPHVHSAHTTPKAMWYVSAALVPIVVASLIFFGIQQIFVILVSVAFAVGTEIVIKTARKKPLTWKDGSAALTGLLLALVLPPDFSLVNTALGSIFAIAVGKELFGGLGYNIFNPALVGRAFLQAAFPVPMTTWVKNNFND